MKTTRALLLAAAMSTVLASCGSGAAATPTPAATPDGAALRAELAAHMPVVDGSTAEQPMGRMLACVLLDVECVWSAPDSANVQRTYVPAEGVSGASADKIRAIQFNNTHVGYLNLVDGKADVLLETRAPSEDELAAAKAKGVEFELTPVSIEAFVFLANVGNPVDGLSQATLRDIYSGKTTTWAQAGVDIGDATAPIHAYQRERNSGSQELLNSMLMKGTPAIDAPEMIVETMLGPFNAIGGDPQTGDGGDRFGLGYSVYFYAAVMFHNPQVKIIGVDGVVPNPTNIAGRTYPLVGDIYAVTLKGAAADSPGRRYVAWLLTADGQRAVTLSGYVALSAS
jgi:phosphate transport system substrate-binding protein